MVSASDLEPVTDLYPDLSDDWVWIKLGEANAKIRRVEALVDNWNHRGMIEAHQLLDALDGPHETGT